MHKPKTRNVSYEDRGTETKWEEENWREGRFCFWFVKVSDKEHRTLSVFLIPEDIIPKVNLPTLYPQSFWPLFYGQVLVFFLKTKFDRRTWVERPRYYDLLSHSDEKDFTKKEKIIVRRRYRQTLRNWVSVIERWSRFGGVTVKGKNRVRGGSREVEVTCEDIWRVMRRDLLDFWKSLCQW